MATPVDVTYTVASGLPIYGGTWSSTWWQGMTLALAVMGDSISAGHNGYVSQAEGGPSGDVTYTAEWQLQQLYGGTAFTFQNYGIGSTYVSGADYSAVASAAPVAAILHSGVNDVAGGHTWLGNVQPALDTIIASMNAHSIHLFVDEILPWTGGSDADALTIRTWNANIATWCTANGATLISCHNAMGQIRVSTGQLDNLKTAYNDDNVHPNRTGYGALAVLWQAGLEAYYS